MRNKGFTLIELLAVIVILAIIALIATPVILGIINDARDSAKINSAQYILDGVETAYAVSYTKAYEDDAATTDVDESKTSGATPSVDHILKEIKFNNATATKEGTGFKVVSNDGVTCTFTVTNDELASDDCGLTGKVDVTTIGAVAAVGSES